MSARITAEGLGKRYTIGATGDERPSFREAVMRQAAAPWRAIWGPGRRSHEASRSELWALRDVTLEVADGEVFGIIGRNGSGKSTLLKILSRIVMPTTGHARVRGRVGTLLEVGAGFHPELTGRDNVFLSGSILGMTRAEIERKFDEIVDFAGVERFIDTPVKRYSTGMYLRLAFAVAAHLETDILIVDEVLAVGDAEFQKKCLGRMQQIAGVGRTVLFVSHNMAAVRSLCHRACVLDAGRIVTSGDVQDCVSRYLRWNQDAGASLQFSGPIGPKPRMTAATLICGGAPGTRMLMGDELTVEVTFETSAPIRNPNIGFLLFSEGGESLLNISNRYQAYQPYPVAVRQGTLRCEFGAIPLVPGRYSLSLYLGDLAEDSHVVEHAFSFEVVERDVWGTAQAAPADSYLWWPATFRFLP